MKTDFVINEGEEEITIQVINGVIQEIRFPKEDYERLKEIINAPKVIEADDFQDFWLMYPQRKRKSKLDAQKAWKKLKAPRELVIKIFAALEKAKLCRDWIKDGGQYIPLPATWLNGHRWEDELIEERSDDKYDPAKAAIERIKARRDFGRNKPDVSIDFWDQVYENDRFERERIGMDDIVDGGIERDDNPTDL